MRILLAEDNTLFSDPLVKFLRDEGFEVILKSSIEQLRNYVASQEDIDFFILDFFLDEQLQVRDSLDNIALIRNKFSFVPILILTEHAEKEWVTQAKSVGANEIAQKPPVITPNYFLTVLLPKINNLIKKYDDTDFDALRKQLKTLSENDLIHKILLPLFRHMGYHELSSIDHHGPGEYGMDILPFYKVDDLGERIYYAAQVKAADINTNASSNSNIGSVLNQAENALKKTFLDIDNLSRVIDKIFIITSGKITFDAKVILCDYLRNNRRILFFDNNRLINLLYKYNLMYLLGKAEPVKNIDILSFDVDMPKSVSCWEPIIEGLIKQLCLPDSKSEEIYKMVMERENVFETLIGNNCALPHIYNTRLKKHKLVLCCSKQSYVWRLSSHNRVNFVALCLFALENKETGEIRRIIGQIIDKLMNKGRKSFVNPRKKLEGISQLLSQALIGKKYEVTLNGPRTFEMQKS